MSEQRAGVQMSHGLSVLQPIDDKALPLPVAEWEFIKRKLKSIRKPSAIFDSLGFLLVGAALTTFISILTGAISTEHKLTIAIAWFVVVFAAVTGGLCIYIGRTQVDRQANDSTEVVELMEHIERRYPSWNAVSASAGQPSAQVDQGGH